MKQKQNKVKPYNVWCDPSAPGQEFEHTDFMKRLQDVYCIDTKAVKGTRKMLSHIDGDTWFSWSYEWEIAGKKFVQNTCDLRRGRNRQIWANE